ncbi:type II secretion system F family protein [Polaromonas sp. YR568]|uniref:type II secretion system F family protein n=1 Tax=Polaromonas sp. YR568 TaxID=1855301 RepID=UPI0031382304
MNSYHVVTIDMQGRLQSSQVEAMSVEEAHAIANGQGQTVLECNLATSSQATGARLWKLLARSKPAATMDNVAFSQDLATLMDAGVTVKEAIHALSLKELSPSRRQILAQLDRAVSEGLSFSAAMQRTGAFPDLLLATVAASEQTGDLATGLQRYARHQQSLRTVRDRVIGASVYPLLLLVVGSVVIAMLLGVVVPRFATLIDINGRQLPFLSQLLMSWGRFVGEHASVAVTFFALLALGIAVPLIKLRDPSTRKRWLEKVPGFSRLAREFQHLQMYRTTAILTSRGITIHKALLYSMELLSPSDQPRLRAALDAMREGVDISSALSNSGLSDIVATSMLNVAERTGSLPEMLDRIADFYERSLQRNIDIVSRLIEPVMMIIFGILIGGIVILMYLPIFDLAASIS